MIIGSINGLSKTHRRTRMTVLHQISEIPDSPDMSDCEGCIQCQMGSKLVLFITGHCHWRCDYCPLSETRREIDFMYANERPCENFDEVIEEARAMRATGAGITGGDPLMAKDRSIEGIRRLKEEFGADFHIHMYTSIPFKAQWAKDFAEAGLDEIRFHFLDLSSMEYKEIIQACSEAGILTGVELPCEPDKEEELFQIIEDLRDFDVGFMNLNELEITVGNHDNMELRGFNLSTEITAGAEGSSELAQSIRDRVMAASIGAPDPIDGVKRDPYGFHLKYCTSVYKDAGQMRRRFLRRGEATISPHETLSEDATLIFGAIYTEENLHESWISEISEFTGLPPRFMHFDTEKGRIEVPVPVADQIASEVAAPVAIVEVTPTFKRTEVMLVWLNELRP
ncbi:MAG: radical SAM protein [Candidatus Thalassarchaeaceae archaeon]|nr:radical SAM protein [Candidatus Thalassarchaeaceae archaeon]